MEQKLFYSVGGDDYISYLIALQEHQRCGQLGVEATIARVRAKFWIISIRKVVKRIYANCVICKRKFARYAEQIMSPLPIERLKPTPPFSNIGVDYFGPFVIKGEVQKRTRGKCYGVIYACDF